MKSERESEKDRDRDRQRQRQTEREKERKRESEKDRDREREERERERERERDRVTRRRDAVFSGKKIISTQESTSTENVDDLLVTLFLCPVQRCLILRRARTG